MNCANCGTSNDPGQKFCGECGSPLGTVCPNCGTPAQPGMKFCGNCGTRLAEDASQPAALAASAGRTPGTVAAPAGAAEAAGVAERRLVSVLFADLVGFTTLSETRDPEATRELLGRYFESAQEIVGRYGGTIEKFIGDAVMAVWGTPTAHEDDAERAVRAALDLIDAVATLAPDLQARAAVLTGEAAVTIGATNQGMVAGDLVNTASRLQSVAPPGSVLVGESTMHAASAAIAFEPAGEQILKGKTAPVPAFRALRVTGMRRGATPQSGMPEPPFVGRDEEMRQLKDLLNTTGRERRARLVSITGQAGIGKSRLAWELQKYIDGVVELIFWHRGRSPAYGEGITFWALGEMVRSRAGLAEGDDERTTRARIAATLEQHVSDETDRRFIEPALLALLGIGAAPPGGREALFAAWRTFFERIALGGVTVLVFEDLQWADSGLLDFIDHVLEWSRGVPILIVTLARPELFEKRPDWGAGKRNFYAMALDPLTPDAMGALLGGFVPGLPETAIRAIVGRADGIPLYAVETVRMLVADGRLEQVEGTYRPTGDLSSLAVPDTLRALIASRLDSLDPADRSLLQDASVLGQAFTLAGLSAISGRSPDDVEPRLLTLVRRELLDVELDPRSPERGQYSFVQSLIREVAHGTLSKKDRRSRHLAAARYLESLGDDELAGALAAHYLEAHAASPEGPEADALAVQARLALRGAAERAVRLGSHDQAVAYLRQALTVTMEPAEQAELLERAGTSAFAAARYEAAEDLFSRAITQREKLGDRAGALRATGQLGRVLLFSGRNEDGLAVLEPAVAGVDDLASDPSMVEVAAALAFGYERRAAWSKALEWVERILPVADRLELYPVLVDTLITKGQVYNNSQRRLEAVVLLDGTIRFAEAHGLLAQTLRARQLLGHALWDDDPRGGYETLRAGLELARKVGDRAAALRLLGSSVSLAFGIGEWDRALDEVTEALGADIDPIARAYLLAMASGIRVHRGELSTEDLATVDPSVHGVTDRGALARNRMIQAGFALTQGRFRDAHEDALKSLEIDPGGDSFAMPVAARAALWADDPVLLRAAAERYAGSPSHGKWPEADRRGIWAAVAALEGRRSEAVAGYLDAIGRLRDLGMPFDQALYSLDFVRAVGPADPDARAAAEEAREIFTRLRARPYLERLEAVLASAGEAGAERESVPEPGTAVGRETSPAAPAS